MVVSKRSAVAPTLQFTSTSRSHPGRRRAVNEDRVLDTPEASVWAIADGMGGLHAGALAAARAIEAVAAVEKERSGYSRLVGMIQRLEALNRAMSAEADEAAPSGSTIVALLVHDGHSACLWAGDSRAYRLRGGLLSRLSHDHSYVQELVDEGSLSEAERKGHPAAHVITRAIGAGASVEIEQRFAAVEHGDVFLLCSDGLTGCIDDHELLQFLGQMALDETADQLLALALERGAPDNVSLVLIRASA
ncbi:MAG: hypothetical protein BGN86_12220 [Caulobacterales bacterium 68-7]|nr:MAG: hypothetical protein BGN86_12220 [Caulobacterales bacterium 68-7]